MAKIKSASLAAGLVLAMAFTFSCTSSDCDGYTGSYGYLPDSRDDKTYKTVVICTQTWMAENLNYATKGSKCYNNLDSNCDTYGRLYNWATAKTACPSGWHLPTFNEWLILMNYVGDNAGTKLKATSGWNKRDDGSSGNGTDEYGFSALPGGKGDADGSFYYVGYHGIWWNASEFDSDSDYAYRDDISYNDEYLWYNYEKSNLFSVRCVKN